MAHHTEQVGFPPLPLNGNMRLRLRALSPTTDAEVAGVTCTLWALYGRKQGRVGPFSEELPTWVPEEVAAGAVV